MSTVTNIELVNALYEALPTDGSAISNERARAGLARSLGRNITPEEYLSARDSLIRQGLVAPGGGQGGTVRQLKELAPVCQTEQLQEIQKERQLYEPALAYVCDGFRSELNIAGVDFHAEITAQGGSPSGKFSRPDVALITSRKSTYTGLRSLQIYSFEIKTEQGGEFDAVLEALSHRQQTHFAYVVWHLPPNSLRESKLSRVEEYSKQFGIGLILIRKIRRKANQHFFQDVHIPVHAARNEPDLEKVDRFIEERMTEEGKQKIISWLRQ